MTLICIYGDCNAILLFTPHFCSAFEIRLLVHSFLSKNVVFPAQAEYFYFSADFRLKIFLYYSLNIIAYDISVLEFIGVSITSVWYLDLHRVTLCMCSTTFRSKAKMSRQTTLGRFGFEKAFRTELA